LFSKSYTRISIVSNAGKLIKMIYRSQTCSFVYPAIIVSAMPNVTFAPVLELDFSHLSTPHFLGVVEKVMKARKYPSRTLWRNKPPVRDETTKFLENWDVALEWQEDRLTPVMQECTRDHSIFPDNKCLRCIRVDEKLREALLIQLNGTHFDLAGARIKATKHYTHLVLPGQFKLSHGAKFNTITAVMEKAKESTTKYESLYKELLEQLKPFEPSLGNPDWYL
jgi:hypothetical protein